MKLCRLQLYVQLTQTTGHVYGVRGRLGEGEVLLWVKGVETLCCVVCVAGCFTLQLSVLLVNSPGL